MEPILEAKSLNLWYGPNHALHDVSVAIPERQITAFIGPSGCGKSTFLRTLNRMNDLIPSVKIEGEVDFHGKNIYDARVDPTLLRKRIGMVFQKANPFPMSIYDNVAYGPRTHGIRSHAKLDDIVARSLRSAAIPGAEGALHRGHGHPQHAAGGPHFRQYGLFPAGRAGGVRQNGAAVLRPRRQAHRGLHHREVRIMRRQFDQQLALLNRELIEMGALCEEVIALASKALTEGDPALAAQVGPLDTEIDQKERTIESLCLKLLLQQQPVARDLRQISAALKMITDMERIGDQAEDIAEIVTFLRGRTAEHDDILCQMARATISMVTESVDAYIKHDTIKAEAVLAADDTVDAYFEQVKHALIGRIAADPADGEYALDLLMIAKYFERIGDHATNIAEWVIFSITGRHKEG